MREECLGKDSRKWMERQGKVIPNQGACHREGMFMSGGGARKKNMEKSF